MKSCLSWADFGLISSPLNVMEVSGPKSSCYCTLAVLTPCFINCLIERVFCVVCPTLLAFFEYLCTVQTLSKFTCLMLWVFVFLWTVLCSVCLFLLQFLTGILTLIPYQLDFFSSVLYVTEGYEFTKSSVFLFHFKDVTFNPRVWNIYVCNTTVPMKPVKDLWRFPWCLSHLDCSNLQFSALWVPSV